MNNSLSKKEAARILKVSTKTLERLEKKGILIPQRTASNYRRYTWEQINQFKSIKGIRGKIVGADKRSFREVNEYLVSLSKYHSLFFVIPHLMRDPRLLVNWIPAFLPAGRQGAGMTRKVAGMAEDLFGVLDKRQKIVYASFISLFLILSVGVVGTRILGLSTSENRLFKGILPVSLQGESLSQNGSGSVLAESTVKPNFVLNVGVPSLFKQNAEFLKELKVQGKMVLTEGIEAPNVINSITAGSGISVTSGQTPTISNTGVISLGGSTGALSLTAGSGITIDGLKITNSSLGSDQKIFKTITVGSTSFSAGSNTDTLTLAAGTGITLSSDTSNKKVTITGGDLSAAGGWTDGGTAVYVTTTTDNVGIGTTSPSYKLDVAGSANLSSGNAYYINGTSVLNSTTLGSAVVTSSLTTIGALASGSIASGFGNISTGNTIETTGTMGSAGNTTFTGDNLTLDATTTALTLSGAGTAIAFTGAGNAQITTASNRNLALVPGGSGQVRFFSSSNYIDSSGNLYLAGSLVSSGSQSGFWQRASGVLSPLNITDDLVLGTTATSSAIFQVIGTTGATTIKPSAASTTALTVRAAPSGSSNIFTVTNNAGTSNYFYIDSSGQLSGSAFKLTDINNAVVGTAIANGWTMNSNTYTYRRQITVTNNNGSNTLPISHQVTLSLSGAQASEVCTSSQSDGDDIRVAYNSTEIARNLSLSCNSTASISFQLQATIAASASDSSYYLYYGNSSLSAGSTYSYATVTLDNADTVGNWTSNDNTNFALSQETTIKNEGTGSVKAVAAASGTPGDIGTFATTSQAQLPAINDNHTSVTATAGGTDYLYTLGGNDGVVVFSTVYKSTINSSGNIGTFDTASQTQLPSTCYEATSTTVTISGTTYIYMQSRCGSVYKTSINASGNVGAFTTYASPNGGFLTETAMVSATVGGTSYVYVIGGNTGNTTVYKSTINNSDGTLGSFATTNQAQLSQTMEALSANTVTIGGTTYVYLLGGWALSTVYKATIDSSGNIGSFATTSQGQLPQGLYRHTSNIVSINGTNYIYVIGGAYSATQSTVYKATIDSSGNIGSFATTSQGQLPQLLNNHSANIVSIGGTTYIYVLGGRNGSGQIQSTVYKATISPYVTYTATKTFGSAQDLSGKGSVSFDVYSSRTGGYANLEFSEDGSTWQTTSYSVSSANTWESKSWDISGITSTSKNAVTKLRFNITDPTSGFTMYFDNITAVPSAYGGSAPTVSAGNRTLGAANLAVNAQGTGSVNINQSSAGDTGTGGFKVYDGALGELFSLNSTGDASVSGSLVLTGASGSATPTIDILNGKNLNIQTSVGGDGGLATKMTILNNGNVGIGDTTPDALFDIDSSDTDGGDFLITNTGAGTSGTVAGITSNSTTTGDILTLSATALTSGSLMIGTGPSSTGVTDHFVKLTSDIGSAASLVNLNPDFSGSAVTGYGIYNTATDTTANANIDYGYYGSLALTGNAAKTGVVIYSTVTSSSTTGDTLVALDLATSATGALAATQTRTVYGVRSQPASTAATANADDTLNLYGAYLNPSSTLATAGTTNVYGQYITSTATHNANAGTVNQYGLYIANGTSSTNGTSTKYGLYVASPTGADTNYAAIFAGGNVGIGTTAPIAALDVRGNLGTVPTASISATSSFASLIVDNAGVGDLLTASNSGNTKFVIANTGNVTVYGSAVTCSIGNGTGATNCSSDIRLKENVLSLDGESTLDKILKLNPVNFTLKNNPSLGTRTGFIAQEVQTVFPEFVSPLPDGYLGLDYAGLVSPLIKAVQELALQGDALQNQVASLSSVIATLDLIQGKQSLLLEGIASSSASWRTPRNDDFITDVLGTATQSASFNPINFESESATISGSLSVLGRTTLNDLGITGTITAGITTVDGLEGKINTIGESLKLQPEGIEGIEMMAGKVTIDTKGNIITQGEISAKKINIQDSENPSVGNVVIRKGQKSIVVETGAITEKSLIFVSPNKPVPIGSQKKDKTHFEIMLSKPLEEDLEVRWWIIN